MRGEAEPPAGSMHVRDARVQMVVKLAGQNPSVCVDSLLLLKREREQLGFKLQLNGGAHAHTVMRSPHACMAGRPLDNECPIRRSEAFSRHSLLQGAAVEYPVRYTPASAGVHVKFLVSNGWVVSNNDRPCGWQPRYEPLRADGVISNMCGRDSRQPDRMWRSHQPRLNQITATSSCMELCT